MAELVVTVPDIGDFEGVDVVEILVAQGDRVEAEQSLIVLESDKATMEIPAPVAGVVRVLSVAVNDQVSEGDPIATLEVEDAALATAPTTSSDVGSEPGGEAAAEPTPSSKGEETPAAPATPAASARSSVAEADRFDVVVLGSGPGGYTAAFRAADLGKRVALVERYPVLGGVCLNVGCIPSKALLHMAAMIDEVAAIAEHGIRYGEPAFDFERIRARKDEVVATLTGGLASMAKARKVEVITGTGAFTASHELRVEGDEPRTLAFEHAIIASGSQAVKLPGLPDDPRIWGSTEALDGVEAPGRLLVVGGGIIGLEMATVYLAFGWQVAVVELLDRLMLGVDRDLVRPLEKRLRARCEEIWLGTGLAGVEAGADGLEVRFDGAKAPAPQRFDRVLVAVGRRPNSGGIGLEHVGVVPDAHGFVAVDAQLRTTVPHVFAIGDLTPGPALAHRAIHQGKAAAEVIAGLPAAFDVQTVPAVAYTDPEVAWAGVTEEEAKAQGLAVRKGVFPWAASGRALGMGRSEGMTKLLFAEDDGRLVGAGMVGKHAGDLVAEATLAIEMGADAEDLGLTIHPHPTLSETVAGAAEVVAGTVTDLPPKRR
jgi:dihydrolipoamide dehydrogenase